VTQKKYWKTRAVSVKTVRSVLKTLRPVEGSQGSQRSQRMLRPEGCTKLFGTAQKLDKPIMTRDPQCHPLASEFQKSLLERFAATSLSGKYAANPTVRGPFEDIFFPVEGAVSPSRPSFLIGGERREIYNKLVEEVISSGKIEQGCAS